MNDYSAIGDLLLKEGSLTFTAVMFEAVNRQPFRISPHHRIICRKLDQVLRGEHPTNRVMFNIPPRHSKTELAVVSFSALGFAINLMRNSCTCRVATSLSLATLPTFAGLWRIPIIGLFSLRSNYRIMLKGAFPLPEAASCMQRHSWDRLLVSDVVNWEQRNSAEPCSLMTR